MWARGLVRIAVASVDGTPSTPIATHRSMPKTSSDSRSRPTWWAWMTSARPSPHAHISLSSIAETVKGPLERHSGLVFLSWNGALSLPIRLVRESRPPVG